MRFFNILYVQVVIAIALGIAFGHFWPAQAVTLKPLGDAFIKLIKMVIPVVIFVGVASGVAHMSDLKKFGRLGIKTLVYFEVISTFALAIGLLVGKVVQPGAGFHAHPTELDATLQGYVDKAGHQPDLVEYLLNLIPNTFASAFVDGNLLQVLIIAVLTGFACARLGAFGERAIDVFDAVAQVFFSMIHILVKFAPLAAFGAMAFTIGKFGIDSLLNLGALVATFYTTSILFVIGVLGAVAALCGFSIFKFLGYIREELLIVLGTSSSETVLPQMMEKLRRLGASRPVVGLVVPTGYSFNLDGTNIYMTLATLFLAQATGTPITLQQELALLAVAMLTSKGASGVTGAGFITLAATLVTMPTIPIASLMLIFGVDRFMSECRALTNLIGNGVATLAIARWEGELDRARLKHELDAGPSATTAPTIAEAEAD